MLLRHIKLSKLPQLQGFNSAWTTDTLNQIADTSIKYLHCGKIGDKRGAGTGPYRSKHHSVRKCRNPYVPSLCQCTLRVYKHDGFRHVTIHPAAITRPYKREQSTCNHVNTIQTRSTSVHGGVYMLQQHGPYLSRATFPSVCLSFPSFCTRKNPIIFLRVPSYHHFPYLPLASGHLSVPGFLPTISLSSLKTPATRFPRFRALGRSSKHSYLDLWG